MSQAMAIHGVPRLYHSGTSQYSLTVWVNPEYDLTCSDTPNYVPETSSTHGVATTALRTIAPRSGGACDPERSRQRQRERKSGSGAWKYFPGDRLQTMAGASATVTPME